MKVPAAMPIVPYDASRPLFEQIDALFFRQRGLWDLFRKGEASLSAITTKRLDIGNNQVIVQANPGRSISTNANVDPVSIAHRPCFLCTSSLPREECGIVFGEYIILPNPFPVLQRHVTIASNDHVPQALENRVAALLALVKSFGPEMFVLYNGPRCGASAPDHMHFQACNSSTVPLFEQLPPDTADNRIIPFSLAGRNLLACSFESSGHAAASIASIIAMLKSFDASDEEPMLNIVALYRNNRYLVNIFPRAKHRSACYFAQENERISISPAAIEMAGIIVVADVAHFDRVDAKAVQSMYKEVTIDDTVFSNIVEALL